MSEIIEIKNLKGQNYILVYPAMNIKGGALMNVKFGGRTDILINTLSDAMISQSELALVVTYATKEFERKKLERRPGKEKKSTNQLQIQF
jgi:hypothetical protein